MELLRGFLESMIPIMVAINAFGVLPIFVTLTEGLEETARRRIARQSVFTACLIAIGFLFLGKALLDSVGIEVEDFMIAGGILLLVISVADIVRTDQGQKSDISTLGAVPLGTPLLAGPATLTTTLILAGTHGYGPVILSLVINLGLVWLVFRHADKLIRLMGINGSRAFAKVASLLLAAIAVRLIRIGITKVLEG